MLVIDHKGVVAGFCRIPYKYRQEGVFSALAIPEPRVTTYLEDQDAFPDVKRIDYRMEMMRGLLEPSPPLDVGGDNPRVRLLVVRLALGQDPRYLPDYRPLDRSLFQG